MIDGLSLVWRDKINYTKEFVWSLTNMNGKSCQNNMRKRNKLLTFRYCLHSLHSGEMIRYVRFPVAYVKHMSYVKWCSLQLNLFSGSSWEPLMLTGKHWLNLISASQIYTSFDWLQDLSQPILATCCIQCVVCIWFVVPTKGVYHHKSLYKNLYLTQYNHLIST